MSRSTLEASVYPCLTRVFSNHPIALAYLYGSTATGTATSLSDVDIALVINEDQYDPANRLNLELKIEDEIVQACGIPEVDVRMINHAPLMLRGEVVTNGILLFSRDEDFRVSFETSTRSEYFDFLPIAAFHSRAYLAHLYEQSVNG